MWWVSDLARFKSHYPAWHLKYGVPEILWNRDGWLAGPLPSPNAPLRSLAPPNLRSRAASAGRSWIA